MHFEQVLTTVAGTIFGFGLLFQALAPSVTPAPAVGQVVVAQTAAGAVAVTEDDPWH